MFGDDMTVVLWAQKFLWCAHFL